MSGTKNASRRSKDYPAGAVEPPSALAQGAVLPVLQQFPIQNDNAGIVRGPGDIAEKTEGGETFLTLNSLETYLWKFRRKTPGAYSEISRRELTMNLGKTRATGPGRTPPSRSGSDPTRARRKPDAVVKAPAKKDKKKDKSKKKGSDSDSD